MAIIWILETEGTAPCSAVFAPSAQAPIIIKINPNIVNKTIEADVELVGTADFTDTAHAATGCKATGSSKSLLIKMLEQKGPPGRSQQFSTANNQIPCLQLELPPGAGPTGRSILRSFACLSMRSDSAKTYIQGNNHC